MHRLIRSAIRTVALLLLVTVSTKLANAQPGTWRTQELCECIPISLDYDHIAGGYAIVSKSSGPPNFYTPTYGRSHWRQDSLGEWRMWADSVFEWYFVPNYINQHFGALDYWRVFYVFPSSLLITLDSSKTWQPGGSGSNIMAVKMFTRDSGYRVAANYSDTSITAYLTYGDVLGFFDRAIEYKPGFKEFPHDVRIISGDTLLMLGTSAIHVTTDRGLNWKILQPAGQPDSIPTFFERMYLTNDNARYYLTGGKPGSDYYSTTDFGNTWTEHRGRFGGRLARLAESSEGLQFAVVMDTIGKDYGSGDLFTQFNGVAAGSWRPAYSDTLFYTTDHGTTWLTVDRFVGDTIAQILRAENGRVMVQHFRDGKTFISTFTPGPASVDVRKSEHVMLNVYPNPSTTGLSFTLSFSGSVRVKLVTILGQVLYESVVMHDAARATTIDYPESVRGSVGPMLLRVEGDGFSVGQLLIKH